MATEYLPETIACISRIAANGGSISNSSILAVDLFVRALFDGGLWDKIKDMGVFAGGQLAAALVKLKNLPGSPSVLTNLNFVAGDYAETGASGGLLGNGATKALRTGVAQSALGPAAHASFYLREAMPNTSIHAMLGAGTAGEDFVLMQTTTEMRALYGKAVFANIADLGTGFWCVNRTGSADLVLYKNGAPVAVNATAATPGSTSNDFALFAENVDGTNTNYLNRRGCFYSLGDPLNAAEMAALYGAVQALQTALNRQA